MAFLAAQTDQHDQTDLRVNVAFNLHHVAGEKGRKQRAAQPEHEEGAKDRDGEC